MGSGFKDFAAGDVLTAADVDGYLMRQTIMTFADASARDSALSGVLDEGMTVYLEDVNALFKYDGSVWSPVLPTGVGGQNLLYNGAMQVAQRSTSVTGITNLTYNTADRWQTALSNLGTWTQSVESDAPTGSGFRKSLKMLCTTADAAPAAGDFLFMRQILEGQDLQQIKKGTSAAESLTLSFWVKSNVTGTYVCELRDDDNTRLVSASYSIGASGTWEKKTVTFPPDTTGAFDNDNAGSLAVGFWLAAGSDFTSGTLGTTWASETAANRAVGQTNVGAATNNYWQVTGVQLEVGPVETPFQHLSYGDELARCQRYYQKISDFAIGAYANALNESVMGTLPFLRAMRANPTVTITSNGSTSRLSSVSILSASTTCAGVQLVATGAGFVGMWASTAANAAIEL